MNPIPENYRPAHAPGEPPLSGEWTPAPQSPAPQMVQSLPAPVVLYVIMALNVAAFIWTGLRDGLFNTDGEVLLKCGALYAPAVWDGQWWRLETATFLHGGLWHIGMNMWVLYSIGSELEWLYGRRAFLLMYLGAGWTGAMASLMFSGALSVGASGAIFGLAGAQLALIIQRRRILTAEQRRMFAQVDNNILTFIAINLFIGFAGREHIDNYAHLGGLFGGFLLAMALPSRLKPARTSTAWVLAICLFAAFLAFTPVAVKISQNILGAKFSDAIL